FCSPHSTFVSEVSSALMQAGITVRTHAGDESRGPGLVIVDAADPDMVEFVRTSSQNGVRRVLVALGPGNDCASEDGWSRRPALPTRRCCSTGRQAPARSWLPD